MAGSWIALLALLAGGCPAGGNRGASSATLQFNVAEPPTPAVTTGDLVFRVQAIFDAIAGKTGSHAPAITAFADGELLAAWYSYDGPGELDGAAIYTSRRPAGADSWEEPALHLASSQSLGNPVLYSEGDEVWLFHASTPGGWSAVHFEVQRSSDRGHTWSASQPIAGPLGANVRFPPLRIRDGTLLLPAYDDLVQRSLFYTSPDGGAWTLLSSVATDAAHADIQPSVVLLADGRLLAVMRNVGGGWLWVSASDDNGRSWTPPQDSGFPNPASATALLRLASGNLILIFNDSATLRHPLSIALSADEGVTWLPPRVLVDGPGDYAYPTAVQTLDGLIQILYSDDRQRIGHITVNEAWIGSATPGG